MSVFFLLLLLQVSSLYAKSGFEDGLHYLPVRAPPFPTRPGKILLYAPFAIKSIKIKIKPLMEGLADKGHKVTVVMPHFDTEHDNITVINVEGAAEESLMMMANQALTTSGGSLMEKKELGENLVRGAVLSNSLAMEDPLLKKQIEEGFDVVIVYTTLPNDIGVYLAHRMGAQLVLYCSGQGPNPFAQWAVGQPFNPAYQTFNGYVSNRNLNFFQRLFNTMAIYFYYMFRRDSIAEEELILDKHFPGEERIPLLELEMNSTSLVLYSGHPLLDGIRPTVPNMQYLGTLHCTPPKPLPKHLASFVESSGDDGVILVSFGSYILGKNMKDSVREVLLKVFSQLKQKVVWKWENETMEGQPDNVALSKWVPQQDVLGHPKTKLFITHAGQSSFQEALCHKTPVIAVPIGLDQNFYGNEVTRIGNGKSQSYHELTEESFLSAIKEVIEDPKYTKAARIYGTAVTDQINKPLDRAIWWIEYLIRHKGRNHLRSPVHDLPWYQYFLLDVIAFLIAVALFLVFLFVTACRKLLSCCFGSKKEKLLINAAKKKN